jgi:transposase
MLGSGSSIMLHELKAKGKNILAIARETGRSRNTVRLFTKTPRDSKAWNKVYAMRSSSERSFKHIKNDYEIEHCRVRSRKKLVFLYSFCCYELSS